MNILFGYILVALLVIGLRQDIFQQHEELFIANALVVFFVLLCVFSRKFINNYFFTRYNLIYVVFYFLLSLTTFYLFLTNAFIGWFGSLMYFYDSRLVGVFINVEYIFILFKNRVIKSLILFFLELFNNETFLNCFYSNVGSWNKISSTSSF
jgi:hypothetical protein